MKILHINDIDNVSYNLAAGARTLGHEAEVQLVNRPGGQYPLAIKILLAPANLAEFIRINARVKAGGFNVVHIHYAYLGWMGILGRYPYFLHCHGTDVRLDLNHPLRKTWVIPALRRAEKVFYVTPDLGEIVQQVRPDAIFLPNPLRTDLFSPGKDMPDEKPSLLMVSALDDEAKGTSVAIQAVTKVHERYPDVTINATAWGRDVNKYRAIPWINFLKPVPENEMPNRLRQYDIMIGQFAVGSLGMAEIESMSCGKPVVSYFIYPEWYPESPPILSSNQAAEVAEFLCRLVGDHTYRQRLGQESRAWVEKYHNYIKVAQKAIDIYESKE